MRNLLVKRVNIVRVHIIIKMVSVLCHNCAVVCFVARFAAEIFLLIVKPSAVYAAAAEAARPAVFIICPSLHTALSALFDSDGNIFKPFLTHVRRLKSSACMHEISAQACPVHNPDLARRFIRVQLFVP